jgi:hypothetical protein
MARMINRRWIVHGGLADRAEEYLDHLEKHRPETLAEVTAKAVAAAKSESAAGKDPKPAFYAALFSQATHEERNSYLRDHFWTRLLSVELQERERRIRNSGNQE